MGSGLWGLIAALRGVTLDCRAVARNDGFVRCAQRFGAALTRCRSLWRVGSLRSVGGAGFAASAGASSQWRLLSLRALAKQSRSVGVCAVI